MYFFWNMLHQYYMYVLFSEIYVPSLFPQVWKYMYYMLYVVLCTSYNISMYRIVCIYIRIHILCTWYYCVDFCKTYLVAHKRPNFVSRNPIHMLTNIIHQETGGDPEGGVKLWSQFSHSSMRLHVELCLIYLFIIIYIQHIDIYICADTVVMYIYIYFSYNILMISHYILCGLFHSATPSTAHVSSASIMMLAAFKSPCASPISGPWESQRTHYSNVVTYSNIVI